jgi:hypothetical protein
MKLLAITVIVITLAIVIYYKFLKHNYTTLFDDRIVLNNKFSKVISNLYLPESKTGIEFTYTFWINIKNIPENAGNLVSSYKKNKFIFGINDSPGFYYNLHKNQIIITLKFNKDYYQITINQLKLQTWIHIAVVLENRELTIYMDGELYKSTRIPSVPFIYNKQLSIGQKNNNFNGALADGRYYNSALSHDKIINVYANNKL